MSGSRLAVVTLSPRAAAALSHSLCVKMAVPQLPLVARYTAPMLAAYMCPGASGGMGGEVGGVGGVGGVIGGVGGAGGEGGVGRQRHCSHDEQLPVLVMGSIWRVAPGPVMPTYTQPGGRCEAVKKGESDAVVTLSPRAAAALSHSLSVVITVPQLHTATPQPPPRR